MAEHFKNIDGWFNFGGAYERALQLPVVEGARWAEVGAYKGKSTAYMLERLKEEERNDVEFHVVDHFQGSEEHQQEPDVDDLYDKFTENLAPLRHADDNVVIHVGDSVETAQELLEKYGEGSFQFVFLDASHSFESVLQDVMAWYPLVMEGGILAGDDWLWNADPRWHAPVQFGVLTGLKRMGYAGRLIVAGSEKWPYWCITR